MQFCETLLSDERFLSLDNNRERIEYILTFVKPLNTFRNEVFLKADNYYRSHRKDLSESRQFRAEGYEHLMAKHYNSSIDSFTKAIMSAPFPSFASEDNCNELSIAYYCRSLVFAEIRDFESSLFDINHSIELFANIDNLLHKMLCLRSLGKFAEEKQLVDLIIEMSYRNDIDFKDVTIDRLERLKHLNVNELQTFVHKKDAENEKQMNDNFWIHPNCEIRRSAEKGRHIIAKEFIPKDTTIMFEKPYNVVLISEYKTKYCNFCLKKIQHKIYPCFECNEVVFCDDKCAEDAMNEYHKGECGLVGYLSQLGSNVQLVSRVLTKIGFNNAYNLELFVSQKGFDINKYILDERQKTISHKNKTEIEKLTEFKAYITLENHNNCYNSRQNIIHCFKVIELTLLLNYKKLINFDIIESFQTFINFTDIALNNIRRIFINAFSWIEKTSDNELTVLGHHLCFVTSLMNHSCDPNINWGIVHKRHTFTTNRQINAGQELCISFIPSSDLSFNERQTKLRNNYFFRCDCNACDEDSKQIQEYRALFQQMMTNVSNNVNAISSLAIAEKVLEVLIISSLNTNNDLLSEMQHLMRFYKVFANYSNVFKFSKYYLSFIKTLESGSLLFDVLIFWTNAYYLHLKEGKVSDSEDWNNCFDLYSKLLKVVRNEILLNERLIASKIEEMNYLRKVYLKISINLTKQ